MGNNDGRPSKLYVALLFAAIGVVGLSMFQADLYGNYGMDTENLTYLDVSKEVVDETSEIKESIDNTQVTGIEPLDQLIAGVYNAFKLLFGIGNIYSTFVQGVAEALKVPGFFIDVLLAIVVVSITFMVIRIISKMEL